MSDSETTLQAMAEVKASLDARLDRIDEAHGAWAGAVGDWSVVNLLQHLTGWLCEMMVAVERMNAGQRPTPDGVDYSDPAAWNPGFVAARGEQTYAEARADFDDAHAAFTAATGVVDPNRFGDGKTINRMVEGVVTHHYVEHADDLDVYLGGEHER